MGLIRVKALHLQYPARVGKRRVNLETLSSDTPSAIEELIHVPDRQVPDQLRVAYAELQIRLRADGHANNYAVRLWPDRCDVSQTPLGERLCSCLRRWGLGPCPVVSHSFWDCWSRRTPPMSHRRTSTGRMGDRCYSGSRGVLGRKPLPHPVVTCTYFREGVPYRLGERYLCNACGSLVHISRLLLWRRDLPALLRWLAGEWHLRGGVHLVDRHLRQIGTHVSDGEHRECSYRRSGRLSAATRQRLRAYRTTLVLYGLSPPPAEEIGDGYVVSLLEVLREGQSLTVTPIPKRPGRGAVRFEAYSGALWGAGSGLGEVTVGPKEFFFLECLAAELDHFVAYADIKHYVLQPSGSTDETEEATFCQGLKSRIQEAVDFQHRPAYRYHEQG